MKHAVGTGYVCVDADVTCVITRFRVRSLWGLVRFYVLFRRVRKEASELDGLITSVFLVEDIHTCYTLSLWRDSKAIGEFNGKVGSHVTAANASFRDLQRRQSRAELWSAQFRLAAVSPHNLRWKGVDLDGIVRIFGTRAAESHVG